MNRIEAIAVAVVVSGLALLAGYQARQADKARVETSNVRTEFANYKATQQESARLLTRARAAETARVVADQTKASDASTAKIQTLERAAARAERNARGLRDALATTGTAGRGLSVDPSAPAECQAAGATIGMLTDMLGECSARRRAVALYADRTLVQAQECEARYDALIPAPAVQGGADVARTDHEPDPPGHPERR